MTSLPSDYIEWTGTERCLEDLFVWWGKNLNWTHSENCKDPEQLHCCYGQTEYTSLNSLQSSDDLVYRSPPQPFPLTFGDWQGNLFEVEIGDFITYRGEGIYELFDKDGNRKSSRV